MRRTTFAIFACLAVIVALAAAPAQGGEITRTLPFELDRWYDLEATDGPVTLHRIRIATVSERGLTKSKIFRPGNSQHLQTIQIQLDYTNTSKDDWEADIDLVWKDAAGAEIDGYEDDETLDDDSRHDQTTITLSTLRYGLDRAKTLELSIRFHRD